MLIGKVLELTPAVSASDNMANRLADKVRNMWLYHTNNGDTGWEETFFEDPDGIYFLREESFPALQGIDYIFRWWGGKNTDELAGDLQVLWKVKADDGMKVYKSTIRFGARDFITGLKTEDEQRTAMRAEFCSAFHLWHTLYMQVVSG